MSQGKITLKETEKIYDTAGRDITTIPSYKYLLELDKRIYELERKLKE